MHGNLVLPCSSPCPGSSSLCPFQSIGYSDQGEGTEKKDETHRKRGIKKDLVRNLEKESGEMAKSDGVGSSPPKMGRKGQLPFSLP